MSQLQKELEGLGMFGDPSGMMRDSPEAISQYAVIQLSYQMLAQVPGLTLELLMAHPDVPADARPLQTLAMIDLNIRLLIASKEFDKVPEGTLPPTLNLWWKHDGNGPVPMAKGEKPKYFRDLTCPHCGHHWPGLD